MTKSFVLDANVLGKLLLNEKDSAIAEKFISKIIQDNSYIFVPSLFSYELVGLLKKNRIPASVIQEFMVENHDKPYVKIINLSGEILSKALDISQAGNKQSGFPAFYDSVYHAIAILSGCDFITADKKHFEKTKDLGHIRLLQDMSFRG